MGLEDTARIVSELTLSGVVVIIALSVLKNIQSMEIKWARTPTRTRTRKRKPTPE